MSKDYLDKWEERQKQNTEIIEQQQTKTKKMSKEQYNFNVGLGFGIVIGIILTLGIIHCDINTVLDLLNNHRQ
tara:strand:- start:354 stop:572 length:219 start_codon:yes stop_codon:yes gene_type:complete